MISHIHVNIILIHDRKKRGKFEYNSIKREHQGLFGRLFSFPARVARYSDNTVYLIQFINVLYILYIGTV